MVSVFADIVLLAQTLIVNNRSVQNSKLKVQNDNLKLKTTEIRDFPKSVF